MSSLAGNGNGDSSALNLCAGCHTSEIIKRIERKQLLLERDDAAIVAEIRELRDLMIRQFEGMSSEIVRLVEVVHELSTTVKGRG